MSESIFSKDGKGEIFLLPMKSREYFMSPIQNVHGRKFKDRTRLSFWIAVPEEAYQGRFDVEADTVESAIEAARKLVEKLGFFFEVSEEMFYRVNPNVTWKLFDSRKEVRKYTYRNLPETNRQWFVSGIDAESGYVGILEWCVSEADAKERLSIMKEFVQFSALDFGCHEES